MFFSVRLDFGPIHNILCKFGVAFALVGKSTNCPFSVNPRSHDVLVARGDCRASSGCCYGQTSVHKVSQLAKFQEDFLGSFSWSFSDRL